MFYATWSRGFRPGGVNRRVDVAALRRRFPDQLRDWLEDDVRAAPLERRDLPREMEGSSSSPSSARTASPRFTMARMRGSTALRPTSATSHGGLTLNAAAAYTDAKTKGNICNMSATHDPDCSAFVDDVQDFHRRAERHAASDHAEVQGDGDRALQLAGVGGRQGARPGRYLSGSAPSSLRTPIELVRHRRIPQTRTTSRAGCTRQRWSTCSPASTGRDGTSSCSPRTSSTSASTSAGRQPAEAARGRSSFPAGRGRSEFGRG